MLVIITIIIIITIYNKNNPPPKKTPIKVVEGNQVSENLRNQNINTEAKRMSKRCKEWKGCVGHSLTYLIRTQKAES